MNMRTIGTTEYIDFKSNIHTVKHSVISRDGEQCELKDKIIEDLYRIFTNKN